ncbi:MAG: UDP-N-acetylglucosamine 2-epimerase [Lentisphaerae bacterium GWF2_52_8]|nr:MAG: UDP-N-acetylglucosamine 2-epimerase [Lentisphaerae bacterium GWF2_52_8]
MPKILVIIGTRPEAIKMAPLVAQLRTIPECEVRLCATAQHREMLDQALLPFGLKPDMDLNLMRANQSLAQLSSAVLNGVTELLQSHLPDAVLVQGDTTTCFASALAASYQKIPVGHVEAGLRTGDRFAPWPEESNRILTTALASWHFAPTEEARKNLLAENVRPENIAVTGNTVIDALLNLCARLDTDAGFELEIKRRLDGSCPPCDARKLVLVTGHRRENFGTGLKNLCLALRRLAERKDLRIIYPVHLNPNVRKPVHEMLGDCGNIFLTEPLDYAAFVYLMREAHFIITDSGGIQEEAPSLGKPVLVTRRTTERPEAVAAGAAQLVGSDEESIFSAASRLMDQPGLYSSMANVRNPYGDGRASARIAEFLMGKLKQKVVL